MRTQANWLGTLSLIVTGAAFVLASAGRGDAHDWYPLDCCHGMDCAPVDKVETLVPVSADNPPVMVVTTKHGTVIVPADFPRRESKDNQMHVCMRPGTTGRMQLLCIFVPPLS
jgi:hypothetical protein